MPTYVLPDFNLVAAVYDNTGFDVLPPPRLEAACNVAAGRRVLLGDAGPGLDISQIPVQLLFPRGTDVRDGASSTGSDLIMVPAGSGRVYRVVWVHDLGGGFANEHRLALAVKTTNFGSWPTPLPPIYVP